MTIPVGGAALVGDRTMIDALKAARDGANHTAQIFKAKAGRASYISEDRLSGHNDLGA